MENIDVRTKSKFLIMFVLLSIYLLISSFIKIPHINGDGKEYYSMSQSIYNHFTPELKSSDIINIKNNNNLPNDYKNDYFSDNQLPVGYYVSNYDKLYSFHFFAYSLFNVPIKYILNFIGNNDLKSFQILNTLLFIFMIFVIFKFKINDNIKYYLILFLIFNPVLYYLDWTHPEVFTYVFVVLSLLYFNNKNYKISFILMSIASWQNLPVIIFSIFVFLHNSVINLKQRQFKNILFEGLCVSISFIPMLFYFYNFGVLNLIAAKGYSSFNDVSFFKIYDMLFGFAHGMILFYPFVVIAFFYFVMKNIFLRDFTNIIYIFSIVIIIILISTAINWNCGMEFIIRYTIWLYPFIIFYLVKCINVKDLKKIVYAHIIFFFIVFTFYKDFSYLEFNKLSKFILNNFPSLYITTEDTFQENILHSEIKSDFPILYLNTETLQVTKILTDMNGLDKLKVNQEYVVNSNWLDSIKEKYFNKNGSFFVNVKPNMIVSSPIIFGKEYKSNIAKKNLIYLSSGWSGGEDNFTWSSSKKVVLLIPIDTTDLNKDLKLILRGFPFNKVQRYIINVNGHTVANGSFTKDEDSIFYLSQDVFKNTNILKIELFLPDAKSGDVDTRELAYGLRSFILEKN